MSTVLLPTKTEIPSGLLDNVERTRLYESFRNNSQKKVTILRAPAGYGKTTLLLQWLKISQENAAWISIDNTDNDPTRFWTYVLHAVAKTCQTDVDQVLIHLLKSSDEMTYDFFIDSFIQEISMSGIPFSLVMDDYHLIENRFIHRMMTKFIELAPSNVHVYLTSRTDLPLPIARWRVHQWVTEFNEPQLRFTLEEAKEFCVIKNLSIPSKETLERLMEQTEGWIAGLQLANLANPLAPTEQLNQDSRSLIDEFLIQEILAPLPLLTQVFLIRTSLLNVLEPELCNQLTERTDSYKLLETLESMGFFIIRLQSSNPVFRYHHLFAEALQAELRKRFTSKQVITIVEETASLLHDKGDVISAIELALKYECYELASDWIVQHLVHLFSSGQTTTFMRWMHHLRSNNFSVPHEMLVMGVITSMSTGEIAVTQSLMMELEIREKTEQWMVQEEHAAIASIYEFVRAFVIISTGGDLQVAKEIIQRQMNNDAIPSRWDDVHMKYNVFEYKLLRTAIGSKGKMPSMEEGGELAELFRNTSYQTSSVTAFIYGNSAESLYERNLIEYAKKELEVALQQGHQLNDPGLFIPMYLLKAKIYLSEGKLTSAQSMLTQVKDMVTEKHWLTCIRIMLAYCSIIAGDSRNAEFELHATKTKQPFWELVYTRLLLMKQQPEKALTLLIQTKTKALQETQIATLVEATVLEAICHNRLGNSETALEVLHEAIQYGAPYYYIRTFLDETELQPLLNRYLTRLQQKGQSEQSISSHYLQHLQPAKPTSELKHQALTPREQEVFSLLADGITNREIAEQLKLTEGTVRVYLSSIYQKLEVTSRAKAILLKYK
ncbi:LuxR C-terminal-related transcriptional regulator [Sporosarcina sp. D27]|uniref:LuxR C-terminal-related transcriptional regulator n=1 Tax=Sporosarcina sp. D27 TaxID=1382305 RepID=UPI0004714556|nr:LuxR C-terminal-related transcriptional regulator [Sporosarcina sp. D27]